MTLIDKENLFGQSDDNEEYFDNYKWESGGMATDTESIGTGTSVGRKTRSQDPIMRWTTGLPKTEEFFWDEPLPDHKLNKDVQTDAALFPPDGMDLADAWVVEIIKSNLTGAERHKRWPKVFASKYLTKSYKMKGRAAKTLVGSTWHYEIGFGAWQFHGDEGEDHQFCGHYGMNQLTYNAVNSQLTKIKSDIRALLHQQLYCISPAANPPLPLDSSPSSLDRSRCALRIH